MSSSPLEPPKPPRPPKKKLSVHNLLRLIVGLTRSFPSHVGASIEDTFEVLERRSFVILLKLATIDNLNAS